MHKKRNFYFYVSILLAFTLAIQFFPGVSLGATTDATDDRVKDDIVLRIGSSKALVRGESAFIDEADLNVIPLMRNSIPFVPLRFIAESLGGTVTVKSDNSFTISLGGKKIDITAGLNYISIDGKRTQMEAASFIENSRTFIPVSSLADVAGKNVFSIDGLVIVTDNNKEPFTLPSDSGLVNKLKSKLSVIPSFGSYDELESYFAEIEKEYRVMYEYDTGTGGVDMSFAIADGASTSTSPSNAESAVEATASPADSADYSEVNIQVQGVDEADIIRTDGKYIYAISSNLLSIIEAYPTSAMEIKSRHAFSDMRPLEMYLGDGKLTVVSSNYRGRYETYITIFDITNKEKPKIVKETGIEGSYLSSRKIRENVYVVTNSYSYRTKNSKPSYYDSKKDSTVPLPNIYVFPGAISYNYLTIAGISTERPLDEPDINIYVGAGTTIYVSQKNMYIAEPSYNFDYNETIEAFPWLKPTLPRNGHSTIIHKFSLYDGRSSYVGSGAVPGSILNQFSMDEYGSYFRIATNANNGNNVYILDSQLKLKSSIEDIAPGERIYSTRFIGNRGYMVTFKTTDPLFAIDLNPDDPKILGALKIPGYSDYLHPYDENTLIGFGKDTVESKNTAYYQGMKMAMFDITDVTNPKQKFVEIIGSRGTESDLLYDHKALLFDKSKNLLAFPVTVYEGADDSNITSYGEFTFQGAYVYDISLDKGFVKRGEITHLTNDEYKKMGNSWYSGDYEGSPAVKRIIYIGDSLYTLSGRTLMAHDIKYLKYQGEVSLLK